MGQRVAILGASNNPGRYAHRAFTELRRRGHEALPVSPKLSEIEGVPCVARLTDLVGPVDTLTMYVGPALSDELAADIVALRPGRVIFNPGSENPRLFVALSAAGIPFEEACTLVLLASNQF